MRKLPDGGGEAAEKLTKARRPDLWTLYEKTKR